MSPKETSAPDAAPEPIVDQDAQEPQQEAPAVEGAHVAPTVPEAASLPAGEADDRPVEPWPEASAIWHEAEVVTGAKPLTDGDRLRCDLPSPGYFPQGDKRAGSYQPGRVYTVGQDITSDQANALLSGGGFAVVSQED